MKRKLEKYEKPELVVLTDSTMEKGHGATCSSGGYQAFCQNGTGAPSNCDSGPSTVNCVAGTGFGLGSRAFPFSRREMLNYVDSINPRHFFNSQVHF